MATVQVLVVWWWWGGWSYKAWGGWGWWVLYNAALSISPWANSVTVWGRWAAAANGAWWNGWNSIFSSMTAIGWGGWAWNSAAATTGWSWWGWSASYITWAAGTSLQGNAWGNYITNSAWWWGWAWAVWVQAWWAGISNSITWSAIYYGWGWGGGCIWAVTNAWWNGWGWAWASDWNSTQAVAGTDWLWWGGWWWASSYDVTTTGWLWVVIIAYHTNWSDWVSPSSTWWSVTTSWGMTIHTFTSNGTFTMVASSVNTGKGFLMMI